MLPTFCPPTIWTISLEFYRKPSILAADDFLGACYRKAMTPQKLWTLLFVQLGLPVPKSFLQEVSGRESPKDLSIHSGDFCSSPFALETSIRRIVVGTGTSLIVLGGAMVRNVPVTPTPSIFPKVLPYKWGAYCRTNGGRTAVQMGAVLRGFPFFEA